MNKIFLGSVALLAMVGGPAFAADMPVKAPIQAPLPVATWTGFYVGGNVGGSWDNRHLNYSDPFTTAAVNSASCGVPAGVTAVPVLNANNPFDLSTSCSRDNSFLGGGQIGYNWQSGAIVYGIEADGQWRRLERHSFIEFGSNPTTGSPFGAVATDTAYFRSEQNSLGTVRGRLGYAPSNWLLYITGGLAVGGVKHSVTEVLSPGTTCITPAGNTCRTVADSKTAFGWTIGAGTEVMFGQWSLGLEYLYVDLGRDTLSLASLGPASGTNFFFVTDTARFDDRSHIARVKLNYHFGAGPVAARY
jgi:outer membrane immunogenic protein